MVGGYGQERNTIRVHCSVPVPVLYSTVRWADLHKISSTGKKVETSGIFDNLRGETGENIIKSNSRNTPILDL